jgi:hypothetical protein
MNSEAIGKTSQLSLNDMWKLNQNQVDIGIEGYVVPNLCKIPNKLPVQYIKKEDEDGNVILPKRPNFLDDVFKLANSFYDKEKAEKIISELEEKGQTIGSKPKPKDQVPIEYPPRKFFTDLLIREEKRKYEYLEDKEEIINAIIEKTKEDQAKQSISYLDKMKSVYYAKNDEGKSKGSLPKATRVTVVSDAEHVGEKYPFYNTYKNPDDPDDANSKKLFYPEVRLYIFTYLL